MASSDLDSSPFAVARDIRVGLSRVRRRLRELDTDADLTPSQTSVLSRLRNDGPDSASGLATAEHVRPQSMAATLSALEARQLIGREPDPQDGRRQLVSLTEAGQQYVTGAREARTEWLAGVLQGECSESERRTIARAMALLERIAAQ